MERNALRAGLVTRAEAWPWGSLHQRLAGTAGPVLSAWPVPMPEGWVEYVNGVVTERELEALRLSVVRGAPYGEEAWQQRTAERLGLQSTLRRHGRPRKLTQE